VGEDTLDQIKFAHDNGFTAWEFNGLPKETTAIQEKVGSTLDDLGMTMGVFVAYGNFTDPVFTRTTDDAREEVLKHIREAVEVAKRANAKWFTVVPGSVDQQSITFRRLPNGQCDRSASAVFRNTRTSRSDDGARAPQLALKSRGCISTVFRSGIRHL
jgi:sugar phosphate isomerase/epimerase